MSKLRILYIVLLVVMGTLLVFTLVKPMATGKKYSEVQRESLLRSDNGWVIQFDIINREGKEQSYTLQFSIDNDKPYREEVILQNGMSFTFIRRVPPNELVGKTGNATFSVYKKGEDVPIEKITYHLE